MTHSGDLLGQAELILRPWAADFIHPEENRMDVVVHPEHLKMAVKTLINARWGYFAALTGLDLPPLAGEPETEGHIEGLYHFCEGAAVLTLRVRVSYAEAVIDSICDMIPSATLYEREFIEMFGVTLRNTPSTMPLLLADDWPAGIYPMRKSFTGLKPDLTLEVKNE
jgi:NADH:ubiquinone oxidoreductase subunit C